MSATVDHVLYCLLSEEGEGGEFNESHGGAAAEGVYSHTIYSAFGKPPGA